MKHFLNYKNFKIYRLNQYIKHIKQNLNNPDPCESLK